MAEVGADVSGSDQGGSGCLNLEEYLRGVGSGVHALRFGCFGNDTAHREGFGRIPPQDGPQADGETTSERKVKWMVVYPAGGSDIRGRITGGGGVHLIPPEHSHIFN